MLAENFISLPKDQQQWEEEFERKWNFQHHIGAVDGKHIVVQAPARSGSFFFYYMAVSNENCEFTVLDIGFTGRNSDGGVFENNDMSIALGQLRWEFQSLLNNPVLTSNVLIFWLQMKLSHRNLFNEALSSKCSRYQGGNI